MKTIKKYEIKHTRTKLSENSEAYNTSFTSPDAARKIAADILAGEDQEIVLVFILKNSFKLIGYAEVHRGGVGLSIMDPLAIFRPIVHLSGTAFVLVHNHPSGSPDPSDEDLAVTKRIHAAAELLGVKMLDHLIIGEGDYTSLAARGDLHSGEWRGLLKKCQLKAG